MITLDHKRIIIATSIILMAVAATALLLPKNVQREGAETVSLIDSAGRNVNFTQPETIMILGRGNALTVSAAYMFPEASSLLVNLPTLYPEAKLYQVLDPEIEGKSSQASDIPNIEEIAAADPDMVILKTYLRNDLGEPLEKLGIDVVYVDFENLETYTRDIENMGKIMGNPARAAQINGYYTEKFRMVEAAGIPEDDKPTALFIMHSTRGGAVAIKAPGPGWLQTHMIETAGGDPLMNRLEGTGWNTLSVEQVAQWDPDVLFIVTYSGDPTPMDVAATLADDPVWSQITAVKEGNVYAVPDDSDNASTLGSWDTPGSRWILCQMWMAKKLQPEAFSGLDLTAEAEEFYSSMYGMTVEQASTIVEGVTGSFP